MFVSGPFAIYLMIFTFGAIVGSVLNVCFVRLRTVSVQGLRVDILYWSMPAGWIGPAR